MKPVFIAPRGALALKPAHGAPCNRCGLCCFATICDLGQSVFHRSDGPCPALEGSFGDARCGLTQVGPSKYRDAAALLVRAGQGCDARFNGEPTDHAFNARIDQLDEQQAEQIKQAKELWGL